MIPKGTRVRVKTTNGGESYATLSKDYVPTYDAHFMDDYGGRQWSITLNRIESIVAIESYDMPTTKYHLPTISRALLDKAQAAGLMAVINNNRVYMEGDPDKLAATCPGAVWHRSLG